MLPVQDADRTAAAIWFVSCNIVIQMTSQEHEPTSTSRVRDYRKRMRELGMRPIQVWVVDVRASSFVADAHRQSAAVAGSDRADDDQAFIDALGLDYG